MSIRTRITSIAERSTERRNFKATARTIEKKGVTEAIKLAAADGKISFGEAQAFQGAARAEATSGATAKPATSLLRQLEHFSPTDGSQNLWDLQQLRNAQTARADFLATVARGADVTSLGFTDLAPDSIRGDLEAILGPPKGVDPAKVRPAIDQVLSKLKTPEMLAQWKVGGMVDSASWFLKEGAVTPWKLEKSLRELASSVREYGATPELVGSLEALFGEFKSQGLRTDLGVTPPTAPQLFRLEVGPRAEPVPECIAQSWQADAERRSSELAGDVLSGTVPVTQTLSLERELVWQLGRSSHGQADLPGPDFQAAVVSVLAKANGPSDPTLLALARKDPELTSLVYKILGNDSLLAKTPELASAARAMFAKVSAGTADA